MKGRKVGMTRRKVLQLGTAAAAGAAFGPFFHTLGHGQTFNWQRFKGKELYLILYKHPFVDEMVKHIPEFESLTGIKAKYEVLPEVQGRQKFTVEMTAGSGGVDAWHASMHVEKRRAWKSGWFQPLNNFLEDKSLTAPDYDWNDFTQGARNDVTQPDKTISALPTFVDPFVLFYRKDLYQQKGLQAMKTWEDFINIAKTLNNPPHMYGCIIPSAETGASTILLETAFMTNNVHWFEYHTGKKEYELALDKGENKKRAVETLEFLNELHKYSPEASTYNWAELMSTFVAEKAANSYYVGARLLEQVMANNARIADTTAPVAFPKRLTNHYMVSIQGFHILNQSNVDGAKQYVKFFLKHPDCIQWYHAVPLHIIPASREVLRSAKYQNHPVIQKRMDVLHFLDSIWGKGVPLYYWDGKEMNPYIGLYHNENLGGWMVAMRNIKRDKSEAIIDEAANKIRSKMKRVG